MANSSKVLLGLLEVKNCYFARRIHFPTLKLQSVISAKRIVYPIYDNKSCIAAQFSQQWIQKEQRKEYTMSAEELKKAINDDSVYLIDVREPNEVKSGKVMSKRFVNIPIGVIFQSLQLSEKEFTTKFDAPKPSKDANDLVFMCSSGVRSTFALQAAQTLGYSKTKHLSGGINKWNKLYRKVQD